MNYCILESVQLLPYCILRVRFIFPDGNLIERTQVYKGWLSELSGSHNLRPGKNSQALSEFPGTPAGMASAREAVAKFLTELA